MIKTVIYKYRLYANSINQLLLLYPYISGYKRNISFLVVFQNNAELRPTGGFIGSLMKVNIEDGKIIDTTVLDVYDVDGQLKGHIDPPQPIRDLLSQEHWYLRDSNWNPDFSLSAEKIAWFYNKETGETVDGVIGINASFVTKLLAITGPIQLLDGGDTITADNFFAKSLYYTQNNFFPGSTQKKDFLGSLMNGMSHLLFSGKYISAPQLFEAIQQSLVTRNIQLYFTDPEAQQLADQFQWGGQVPLKTLCEIKTPCIGDFIMINEANLGVNKANVFITRQDMRDITVKTNGLSAVITRTIKNHSAGEPGSGTYKTYIRFFLPSSAVVTSLTIDGEVVPVKTVTKNGIPPLPYGEYDTSLPGLTGIAVALEIPVGKEKTIRLAYEIQNAVIYNTEKVQVELYEQKQSGIDTAPTVIKLRYPTSWKPITALDQLSATLANQGYLEYNTTMSQDVDIHLVFGIK